MITDSLCLRGKFKKYLSNYFYLCRTFNELILIWTMIGAKWVLIIWFGWLIVSASITTNCNPRANSKILSTSFCTSTKNIVKFGQNIRFIIYANLQRFFFRPSFCSLSALSACLASERSAGIRVILTLPSKWRRMKSKTAFCIMSVTEIIIITGSKSGGT